MPQSLNVWVEDVMKVIPEHWPPCRLLEIGNGRVYRQNELVICAIGPNEAQDYHNAQLYDYSGLERNNYPWRPPLRMTVRAWASHPASQLKGTAGFGFWNQPVKRGSIRLPRAAWFFFGSPPNNMALAKGVAGHGWKAATFDATHRLFFALLPFAPLGFLLMRIPAIYNRLWPIGQRAIGVSEQLLPVDLDIPHTYELIWRPRNVDFFVDGVLVHHAPTAPKGPLGFALWIDNQYAIVTPRGNFGGGQVAVEQEQWLAVESVEIRPLK